jgi:NADPH-dependent 2,4-dienoyl-CoA reductase/sulfur reductase-like enzyme
MAGSGIEGVGHAAKDNGPVWAVTQEHTSSADVSGADTAITAAPAAGFKVVADDVLISVATACRVDLKEETSGTVLAAVYLPDNGSTQVTLRNGLRVPTAAKKLMVRTSAASAIRVTVSWHTEQ